MSKRVDFKVSLELPDDATLKDAKEYVESAVRTMKGELKPASMADDEDPYYDAMFYLDPDSVRVTQLKKKT